MNEGTSKRKLLEMFQDFIFHFRNWVVRRGVSGYRFSIFVDDELCKIPLDEVAEGASLQYLTREQLEMRRHSIYFKPGLTCLSLR